MIVRKLIEALQHCNPDAVVYLGNPNMFGSNYQEAHEKVGVRYLVNGNEEVWFETYGGENIAEEVRALADAAINEGCDDGDLVRELIDPDGHGYTWDDLYMNLLSAEYEWLKETAKEYGLI